MRKYYLCIVLLFFTSFAKAQWRPLALNYKYTKHPDFFIPQAIHFSDSANGYILTTNNLLQLKNFHWVPVYTGLPDSFTYTNLYTLDSVNTFLCGWDGRLSKFNGDSIQPLFMLDASETANPLLNTICMIDSTKGWAAGEAGTVVWMNGGEHTMYNQLPQYSFKDIYFDSPQHGWMIGKSMEEGIGVIFEFTNGEWALHSTLPGGAFDIEFTTTGKGFVTGEFDIYRYHPTIHQWVPENIQGYYRQLRLSMLNDYYGISVSDNNQNLQYQGGVWKPAPAASVADLADIKVTANGNAWAISAIGNNNPGDLNDGKIQLLENGVWATHTLYYLDTIKTLPLDIAVTSIVGLHKKKWWFDGQYLALPDYTAWPDSTPSLNNDTFCNVVKMYSDSFGLGLNGYLLEWRNGYWHDKNIDPIQHPDTSISTICMQVFDDTTGFICRQLFSWSSGELLHVIAQYNYQTNGLTHSTFLDTRYPCDMHFFNKHNGWVVGDNGLMAQYSANRWTIVPGVTNNRLNSVFTLDASTAWAAGDGGTLLHYSNGIWVPQQLPTQQNLRKIFFVNNNNGWVVGDSGLIYYYNGTRWEQQITNITSALYAIYMIDSAFGFAGGENGTLLQFVKPAPPTVGPVQKFCEYANTFYTFPLTATPNTYQWQIDTGNGFVNLAANAVFSGVQQDTLWLANVPPAYYGYKFRCIATYNNADSISSIQELKFVNKWTGMVSNAWEDAGNWSCGSLPGENTDVIINSGTIILSTETSVRSLTASPGVHITCAENALLQVLK